MIILMTISNSVWFRKGYSTLNFLLVMFKESAEKGNEFGDFLTDHQKHVTALIINCYLQNYSGMESHLRHLI